MELEQAIGEGEARRVLELVQLYGLPRSERLEVCRVLDRPPADTDVLRFDQFDRATLAGVWDRAPM